MATSESKSQKGTHISVIVPNFLLDQIEQKVLQTVIEKSDKKLFKYTRTDLIIDSIISANNFSRPRSEETVAEQAPQEEAAK